VWIVWHVFVVIKLEWASTKTVTVIVRRHIHTKPIQNKYTKVKCTHNFRFSSKLIRKGNTNVQCFSTNYSSWYCSIVSYHACMTGISLDKTKICLITQQFFMLSCFHVGLHYLEDIGWKVFLSYNWHTIKPLWCDDRDNNVVLTNLITTVAIASSSDTDSHNRLDLI
jgi:hypothetical protein